MSALMGTFGVYYHDGRDLMLKNNEKRQINLQELFKIYSQYSVNANTRSFFFIINFAQRDLSVIPTVIRAFIMSKA